MWWKRGSIRTSDPQSDALTMSTPTVSIVCHDRIFYHFHPISLFLYKKSFAGFLCAKNSTLSINTKIMGTKKLKFLTRNLLQSDRRSLCLILPKRAVCPSSHCIDPEPIHRSSWRYYTQDRYHRSQLFKWGQLARQ